MNLREETLRYHLRGEIDIKPSKSVNSSHDLSSAYSLGIAEPCIKIASNNELTYTYTNKANLVATISNGPAVLGPENIDAQASRPIVEGKACLFKEFIDINVYDLEIGAHSIEEIIAFCKAVAPTLDGVDLEDISAPKCSEVEAALQDLGIPVVRDDQHGTAVISAAGLVNAVEISGKKFKGVKIVVSRAGTTGTASTKMYRNLGVKNIILIDSKGVVNKKGIDLSQYKLEFVGDTQADTLKEAMKDAGVFLGLSTPKILNDEMISSMAKDPVIFTLANPAPEVMPENVIRLRKDVIVGTGRGGYPSQISSALDFPLIFRRALDVRAAEITESIKIAAAKVLAGLAKLPVSDTIKNAYEISHSEFGKDYVIPKPFDEKVKAVVSTTVTAAAVKDGVALLKEFDEKTYFESLK